jgi:hypothetical protein
MSKIYRCPKCDARFDPPRAEVSECPHCGLWFHKWNMPPEHAEGAEDAEDVPAEESLSELPVTAPPDALTYYSRAGVLVFLAIWGFRLAAMDYRDGEINASFMHNIVLPIHEAGHIFFIPGGEFMTILGGSLFQLALPLCIGAAFLWRQRDAFGAAACLWWTGASAVDLAPYIWDSLDPQLIMLGGRTGEDGPHDWIYLLDRLGLMQQAHTLGVAMHHFGVLLMLAGLLWGGWWLCRNRKISNNHYSK